MLVVGKGDVRANEDTVFDSDAVVDADSVLQLAVVADAYAGIDVDAVTEDAVGADSCPRPDVGVVPNTRAFADLRALFDLSGGVDHASVSRRCVPPRGHRRTAAVAAPPAWVAAPRRQCDRHRSRRGHPNQSPASPATLTPSEA